LRPAGADLAFFTGTEQGAVVADDPYLNTGRGLALALSTRLDRIVDRRGRGVGALSHAVARREFASELALHPLEEARKLRPSS
jgi:hypothetical protein